MGRKTFSPRATTKAAVNPGGACNDKNPLVRSALPFRAYGVARRRVVTAAGSNDAAHRNTLVVGIIVGAPSRGRVLDDCVDVTRTKLCMTAMKTIEKIMRWGSREHLLPGRGTVFYAEPQLKL